jgi:hypothetical protein
MRTRLLGAKLALALAVQAALSGLAAAQMTNVAVPFHTASNSFFEQFGVNFGFQSHNFFFQQNSFGLAAPPFGGFTPNAAATTGFSTPLLGGRAYFNISAGQGSQTSLVSQTPGATLTSGVQGGFFATTQTPFVTSVIPTAGDSPLAERLHRLQQEGAHSPRSMASGGNGASGGGNAGSDSAPPANQARPGFETKLAAAQTSSAGRPTLSVAELRQLRAQQSAAEDQARQQETQALVSRGAEAEQAGKWSVARLYFEQAARRADALERDELLSRVRSLPDASAKKPARISAAKQ